MLSEHAAILTSKNTMSTTLLTNDYVSQCKPNQKQIPEGYGEMTAYTGCRDGWKVENKAVMKGGVSLFTSALRLAGVRVRHRGDGLACDLEGSRIPVSQRNTSFGLRLHYVGLTISGERGLMRNSWHISNMQHG